MSEDFSDLPAEEKIGHSVWKVRLQGYQELIQEFENLRSESDPCFSNLGTKPELLKNIATDANVVAQESGLLAITKFLEMGGTPMIIGKLKNTPFVPSLCEKGLSSSRAATKQHAIQVLLLLVEIGGQADWVLEQMTPYYSHKLPKLVAGCVTATCAMVGDFGCKIVPAKTLIPVLAKLFGHADRNVRGETTRLAAEMRRWLGESLDQVLFPLLKPVQQRDLAAEFAKLDGEVAVQKRLTREQKERESEKDKSGDAAIGTGSEGADGDVHMEEADPMDLLDPVDVLSKLPSDLSAQMASSKWKDRKDALEVVISVLSKAPKLVVADYGPLVRIFAKCMKDANIQVVQLAAIGVEYLAKGLRGEFQKYQNLVLFPLLERSKEKKPAVADALANALDAIFAVSSLLDVLEDTLEGMKHKTPQVKISATNFLQRCLKNSLVVPKTAQIDAIMEFGVKLLSESQEPIRQASTELIGTLMRITGERELKSFLEKVDDNRLQKVKKVYEEVSVRASKANLGSAGKNPERVPDLGRKPDLKGSAIPSKRLATSPAKRADSSKVPSKGFTGRLLISPSIKELRPEREALPTTREAPSREFLALQEENRMLKERLAQSQEALNSLHNTLNSLREENKTLVESLNQSQADISNGGLMVRQKETQILRLGSDLDNAKLKIKSLEQTIEMLKLQQSTAQVQPLLSSYPEIRTPYKLPVKATTLQDLSSRVDRMSIEGKPAENFETFSRDDTGEEENWKKAAEVTAQLKARIEKMKQRNRLSSR